MRSSVITRVLWRYRLAGAFGLASLLLIAVAVWAHARATADLGVAAAAVARSHRDRLSSDCRACHEPEYRAWAASHHAQASRPVEKGLDAPAFEPSRAFKIRDVAYGVAWEGERPTLTEEHPGEASRRYSPEFALAYAPLRQYVIPVGHGRYQTTELGFDPARREWFDVFGADDRQPGEWGYWLGRGMNWNSRCAHCHMTDFAKQYDAASDSYASTWLEHGVGCVQCHGDLEPDHAQPGYRTPSAVRQRLTNWIHAEETCAPCHARNELLTGAPRPGMSYPNHFRLSLPVDRGTFYPDGQVHDEDFNWTSFLTSRMGGKARVTCLDCHDPHSGRTKLPTTNNALCLQCHGGPNPKNAPIIDPTAHSHHGADSAGNRCVACHMPTTTYMQRDPRHDHGFLKPDPQLTRELGIPNACDRCHSDRGVDWEIAAADKWYGAKLESRQRLRARAVDAAEKHSPDAARRILVLLDSEDVPVWKAALLQLLRPWVAEPEVTAAGMTALADSSPYVRAAAVELLGSGSGHQDRIRPALKDESRLVRIDAATVLTAELARDSRSRRELDAYLALNADQPTGQLRLGDDFAARDLLAEAELHFRIATDWEPRSPAGHEALGLVLNRLGDNTGAGEELWRAAQLDGANASLALEAALAFAAVPGHRSQAESALREAVRRDPTMHRAWYNLGLLLVRENRLEEAVAAIRRAAAIAAGIPDYPYAEATILWQAGRRTEAYVAARRALQIDPQFEPAQALLSREHR